MKNGIPVNEYKSKEKEDYRERVWRVILGINEKGYLGSKRDDKIEETNNKKIIREYYRGRWGEKLGSGMRNNLWRDDAKFLIMPANNGMEIHTLLKLGVKAENIICVEYDQDVLNNSRWYKIFKKLKVLNCKISECGKLISKKGWFIGGANFDMCNNFSDEMIYEIETFFKYAPIEEPFRFCINMIKGRESRATTKLLDHIKTNQNYTNSKDIVHRTSNQRIISLLSIVEIPSPYGHNAIKEIESGEYINSKVPMTWGVFQIDNPSFGNTIKNIRRTGDTLIDAMIDPVSSGIGRNDFLHVKFQHKCDSEV